MKIRNSLSTRISLRVLLFSSIFFIIILYIIYNVTTRFYVEEAERSTDFAYESGTESINGTLSVIEATAKGFAWLVEENYNNRSLVGDYTYKLVKTNETIVAASVVSVPEYNNQGIYSVYMYVDSSKYSVQSTSLYSSNYNYLMTEVYLIPKLLKKPVWSEPYYDEGGCEQTISTYSIPLIDNDNIVYAVVSVDISLDWLSDIADETSSGFSETYITSKGGTFLASNKKELISSESIFSFAIENHDEVMIDSISNVLNGKTGIVRLSSINNIGSIISSDTYTVYGPLKNGWSMAVVTPFSQILQNLYKIQWILLAIAIIGLIVLAIMISSIVRKQIRPIKQFSQVALDMARGHFNTALPELDFKDEINDLRESMVTMQKDLNQYIIDLKTSTAANERFESELEIAKKIQLSLVPNQFPDNQIADIYGMIEPAREVGGDLFDYNIYNGKLYFFVGDVSGKGVPASLYMSFIISALNFVMGLKNRINEMVEEVNNYLSKYNQSNVFITMFVGCYNPETKELEYCNCGHNPIVIKDNDGNARFLSAKPNLVMGAFEGFKYESELIKLQKGDKLILYTDGVTEAERKDFNQYSEERLIEWAKVLPQNVSSEDTTKSLYKSVKDFAEGNIQNDDITIMTITIS